jgi:hypothetical protein
MRTHPAVAIGIAIAATLAAAAPAADIAVPAGGEDTVARAIARAGASDVVFLLRGGVYREPGLTFRGGVTVKSAGPSDKPPAIITASVLIGGFKPWAKNPKILSAPCEKKVLACYVDGACQTLARYPNISAANPWLHAGAGSNPETLTCPERAQAPGAARGRWKGAEVRWRRWSWWFETRPITDDDGSGRLTLGAEGRFHDGFTGVGSSFYVDNCLAELDAPGEWFWEESSKTFYLYPPSGADAAKMQVEVAPEGGTCTVAGATLDGIGFARFAGDALKVDAKSTIASCLFAEIGGHALTSTWNSSGTLVTGCTFRDIEDTAIEWNENPKGAGGTVFERNTLERVGDRPGLGGSGSWHGAGITAHNAKVTIRLNRMVDIGYAGVITGAPGCTIERNVFVRCMSQLNDGAAIYACTDAQVMRENIILDTIGNTATSHPWSCIGHGIWCEFLGDHKDMQLIDNTIFGAGGHGIFLPNNRDATVRGNVSVGNRRDALHLGGYEKDKSAQGHVIADNVLVAIDPPRALPPQENAKNEGAPRALGFEPGIDYGKLTGTTLIAAGAAGLIGGSASFEDAAAWAKAERWGDAGARCERATPLLLINDTEQPHDFAAPGGGWSDLAGKPAAKAITVAPFHSVVLLRKGADAGGLPPYVCASGIDYRARSPFEAPTESVTAKAAKSAAAPREEADVKHAYASTKPTAPAWTRRVEQLRDRVAELSRGRRPVEFDYSAMRQRVLVLGVDGANASLKLGDSASEVTAALFGPKLGAADAMAMALDAQRAEAPEQYALAAFFARCADDAAAYQRCLAHAGDLGAALEADFAP